MKYLLSQLKNLKNSPLKKVVEKRIKEFENDGKGSEETLFDELCFCLMTANFSATGALKIQKENGQGFIDLSLDSLSKELKKLGYRFPNARAKYIVDARAVLGKIRKNIFKKTRKESREWLRRIKGLGMKESSHFLRNVGFKDVAIIYRHILTILFENEFISDQKLTTKRYTHIERILENIGKKVDLDLARLDLYI